MVRIPLFGETEASIEDKINKEELSVSAGSLAGRFSNPRRTALVGAGLVMAALVTFLVTYFVGSDSSSASAVLWITGWIAIMAGFILLVLAADVHEKRKERFEEELMKSEPTYSAGLDTYTPRIVMVRCKYCGTLNAENASKCLSCGATL